ncbi:protein FAR1-RELATED SEQUENCE 3-like [Apium graveolens]|uniref:protein FAR1-RELATED SEQUENCE 3-like n=1 Tax=Apium graveolens TaxID=4045 RepID=UPI003D7C079E
MNIFGKLHGRGEHVRFHAQYLRNMMHDFRKDNLGVNDAQAGFDLLHRLEEESGGKFSIWTLTDEELRLKCLLRVDPRSWLAYKNFVNVVAFDITYRTNRYDMSFVPFTGVNHHYQSVLFGFALMRDELKTIKIKTLSPIKVKPLSPIKRSTHGGGNSISTTQNDIIVVFMAH